MDVLLLAGITLAVLAIWFVCAPLLRGEDDLQPLYQSRPGVRHLSGSAGDEPSDTEYEPLPENGHIRCQHCGTVNDATYGYCAECLEPLT